MTSRVGDGWTQRKNREPQDGWIRTCATLTSYRRVERGHRLVHAVAVTDVGPSATVASLDEQELPLVMLDSPYRAVVAPLARYVDALRSQRPALTVTFVLAEPSVKHRWHRPPHNRTARRLRRILRRRPKDRDYTVPQHLPT